jgi:hypothetical protein
LEEPLINPEENNYYLTIRLLEEIQLSSGGLRRRHAWPRVSALGWERSASLARRKELTHLLSGLTVLGYHSPLPWFQPGDLGVLNEYLDDCERFGFSIGNYVSRTASDWGRVCPQTRLQIEAHAARALNQSLPGIDEVRATEVTSYLFNYGLERVIHSFPFDERSSCPPLVVVRSQPDLPWNVPQQEFDFKNILWLHFPEIDWANSPYRERPVWFVGFKILSRLNEKIPLLLQRSLSGLDYLLTTRTVYRTKLVHLVFFSEGQVDLFRFNLVHYSKLSSIYFHTSQIDREDFRQGYPGLSGFFDKSLAQPIGLRPWKEKERGGSEASSRESQI